MTMTKVKISGCDDETDFEIEATTEQIKFLGQLAAASKTASEYGCQPIIIIGGAVE